jgi:hypothetical protein
MLYAGRGGKQHLLRVTAYAIAVYPSVRFRMLSPCDAIIGVSLAALSDTSVCATLDT